ncbi:TPA: hypothetical protein QEG37_004911 [Pluralibacter gergoviae]|nr:hypothetical protein [Pluralibacter gergoviae]HDS1244318.1 hypothetical protein [Pluralibacter gergoviae]HDS1249761.1 hypothetical protein [Pluralibacter gergoviae]HDS1255187.1 hypothetical protein [Pluralibacter gergoviae]HDS1260800.1 hypothetical protein [Pluralibacter gergoviae]
MIPASLAKSEKESRLKRAYHIAEARYWRAVGNAKMKNLALSMARDEVFNMKYFLGEPPF